MSDNMRNMKDSFEATRVSKALDDIVLSVEKFTDNARETEEELKAKAEKTEEQTEEELKIIEDMVEPEEPKYTKVRDAKKPIYPPIKKPLDNYSKLDIKGMPSNLIVIDDTNGEFKQTGRSWYFSVPDKHRLILDATTVHRLIPINDNPDDNYDEYCTEATHHFNPLWLAYYGEQIDDLRVHDVVNLIMESFFKDYSSIDEAVMTMFVYYILEEDDDKLRNGFVHKSDDFNYDPVHIQPLDGGRCLSSILKLVQEAKVPYDEDEKSIFQIRLEDFFRRKPCNKTSHYYDTFLLTGHRTASEALLNIAASLHYFSCPNYDYITRTNFRYPALNLSVDNVLMQSQDTFYLDLVVPNKKIMNFLARAVQKMISQREKELNYEWFIGYCRQGKKKTEPYIKAVFGPFDCKEDAIQFYESATTDFISESGFKNGSKSYDVIFKNKSCKQSFSRETLVQELEALNTKSGLEIWQGIY